MLVCYRRNPKFDYIKPKGFNEALELLKDNQNGQYLVYAGGTDLMPKLKNRKIDIPGAVVDLKGLSDLDYIRYNEQDGMTIGALTSIYDVATSSLVNEMYPVLAQGANSIAAVHIQNRATMVGNICSAVPSADSIPPLLTLEAKAKCVSHSGERDVSLLEFFSGPMQNVLQPGEIIKEIQIPPVKQGMKGKYLKLSPRVRMDLAIVGVAVWGVVTEGIAQDVRIGLGAVAPTPIRAKQAEAAIHGKEMSAKVIEAVAKTAADEASPIDDHRASAEYRKMMIEVLAKRGLNSLIAETA